MEVISIGITILFVLLLVIIAHKAYHTRGEMPIYVKMRNKFKKPKPGPEDPPMTRMFVVIRRQPAGRTALSAADAEQYEAAKKEVSQQLKVLLDSWTNITKFSFGFHGSEYGLPSNNDENWLLFASFETADHNHFRECLALLSHERFFALRNQLDIRLLYGEKMEDLRDHLDELFN